MSELVIRGARILDPARGIDMVGDVAFSGGKVAAVGPGLAAPSGAAVHDAAGRILVPGLIDLHTHIYWGATSLGVDGEMIARRSGATTLVDAGSAGPGNFHGFRRFVAERAFHRTLAYLNISYPGIYAFSAPVMVGECADLRLLDLGECVRVARENRDLVVGIKVRVGRVASGASGMAPLDMAIEVAEELGLPVMAHVDYPPPGRKEVLERLRPGDILTHCFKPFPNAPARGDGRVFEEVLSARRRGVLFDIGHGAGSFGFATARAMLAAGFLPDAISSDVHILSVEGPAYDLLVTLSKFLALGMALPDVIRAATSGPAAALRRSDLGTLAPGAAGDATLLALEAGSVRFRDAAGETIEGRERLCALGMVRGGRWQSLEKEN